MDKEQRRSLAEIIARYRTGQISRRRAVQLLSAFGLAGVTAPMLAGTRAVAQDAGTPAPVATPVLGPQADGTNVWKVQVGGMDMENGTDLHAFFPGEITVNAGDTVFWAFAPMGIPQFHTVTFTSGERCPPIFVPDIVDGTPVASPEGPPRIMINPMLAFPDGRTDYDGTGLTNSGLDVLRTADQPPYTLTFTTPGTYDYACAVHGIVMKGKVIVQEAGAELPTDVAGYEAMAQEQIAAVVEIGKAAIDRCGGRHRPSTEDGAGLGCLGRGWWLDPGPRHEVRPARGHDQGRRHCALDRSHDRRTAHGHLPGWHGTTGRRPDRAAAEADRRSSSRTTRSFLPAGEATFDGTGYRNSGFLGLPPEIGSMFGLLGETYELTFTAAGEYPYYCILHSGGPDDEHGMAGKVIVEE